MRSAGNRREWHAAGLCALAAFLAPLALPAVAGAERSPAKSSAFVTDGASSEGPRMAGSRKQAYRCRRGRAMLLDDFNRPDATGPGSAWEATPYRLPYSLVGVRNNAARQADPAKQYSAAQWRAPLAVTRAISLTMGKGFNRPNPHPSLERHELFLNLAHDLGVFTNTLGLSPLGGYELGIYPGYNRHHRSAPRSAMWELYRFDAPGYTTLSRSAHRVAPGDRVALAYTGRAVLGLLKPAGGERWRIVTRARDSDSRWLGAVGKPAFHMTPGYSVDDFSLLRLWPGPCARGRAASA